MIRQSIEPREDWQGKVESQGLLYHSMEDGTPYWNESAYYSFTSDEIDRLEQATNDLQAMFLEVGQRVIDRNLFSQLNIGPLAESLIRISWESEPPAIYGRMDLCYTGSDIKLLEYNADTPTSLLEAAVIQWYWKEDTLPYADQFNSIHERLVSKWRELISWVGDRVHFASLTNYEDIMTNTYLMETARQGGIKVTDLAMSEIGYRRTHTTEFVDLQDRPITTLFKLYPWENLLADQFGRIIPETKTQWMEPAWKMMFSNKGILSLLWEQFEGHPLLLPAYRDKPDSGAWVRKPLVSREGSNIQISDEGTVIEETGGPYGGPTIYQQFAPLPSCNDRRPVIGSWLIDGISAGMGIRESSRLITGNTAQFVPHVFI